MNIRSFLARALLVSGVALTYCGAEYALKRHTESLQEDAILGSVWQKLPEERLKATLDLAFRLPPHLPPVAPPKYDFSTPLLSVLGPPASQIYEHGGHCGRRARLLIVLLAKQGISAQKIHLVNQRFAEFGHASEYVHAVVEARVGEKLVILDPLYDIIYRRADGSYAGLDDIRSDPTIFRRGLASADTRYGPYYPSLYTFENYRKFKWSSVPGGRSVYRIAQAVLGEDRARDIPGPVILETPLAALSLFAFLGAFVVFVCGVALVGVRSCAEAVTSAYFRCRATLSNVASGLVWSAPTIVGRGAVPSERESLSQR